MQLNPRAREVLTDCLRSSGAILLHYFGSVQAIAQKHNASNVVCQADLDSERLIVDIIRNAFPSDGIVAEESGFRLGNSGLTWIIDPLDGTSNFVAGIPWFGVQIALLSGETPIVAGMYLPKEDLLYIAQKGHGLFRNGVPIKATEEPSLEKVLCSFGMDMTQDEDLNRRSANLLVRLAQRVRNIRVTNSLVDFAYTLEGRLGGCINLSTRVWDIAPAILMFSEAGGTMTDLHGEKLLLRLNQDTYTQEYKIVGASDVLHSQLVAITSSF